MKAESDPTKWLPATSALQLQRPEYLYFGGEVRPWDEAVLHVSTEAVVRGLNVFEGLKATGKRTAISRSVPFRVISPAWSVRRDCCTFQCRWRTTSSSELASRLRR